MPQMSDDLNRIPLHGHRPQTDRVSRPKKGANTAAPEKSGLQLPEDTVEITGKPHTANATEDTEKVNIKPQDLQRYTQMLMDMPDIDEDKVAEVEAILAGDGYDESVLPIVVEGILRGD